MNSNVSVGPRLAPGHQLENKQINKQDSHVISVVLAVLGTSLSVQIVVNDMCPAGLAAATW